MAIIHFISMILIGITGIIISSSIGSINQTTIIQLRLIEDVMARQRVQKIRNDDLEARLDKLEKR